MQYKKLTIKNFKSIDELIVEDIEMALILVGKNNAGKGVIIDAFKILSEAYELTEYDFNVKNHTIFISAVLELTQEDLMLLHSQNIISKAKDYSKWLEDIKVKIPSFTENRVTIECHIYPDLSIRFSDGVSKNNPYVKQLMPKLYIIGDKRDLHSIEDALLDFGGSDQIDELKKNLCLFDKSKLCNNCFNCLGVINKKSPEQLSIFETVKLLQYKLYQVNLKQFMQSVNQYFKINYATGYKVNFDMDFDAEAMLRVNTTIKNLDNNNIIPVTKVSAAMRSLYILSMFQAYNDTKNRVPYVIIMEEPEIHLHPELQKTTSEILYRLSKKNQVIFSTHSPNMLFNFSIKHIRQTRLDHEHHTIVSNDSNLDIILADLGYSANDFLNIDFALIVEGKDDIKRFKMILNRFYNELEDESGNMPRLSMVPTNSCTNIKTYANLKYINKTYLKDNFMMIRDSDGKDPDYLVHDLCDYYYKRIHDDEAAIPRITPQNVLVLKYYSLENYFLDPELMVKIGLVSSEEVVYITLYNKFNEYLYNLKSYKKLFEKVGHKFKNPQDVKDHYELIRIYMRGHNLFDIFYTHMTKEQELNLLNKYLTYARRHHFQDILNAFEKFAYFDSKTIIEKD